MEELSVEGWLAQQIDEIGPEAEQMARLDARARYAAALYEQRIGLYSLAQFAVGETVVINLEGQGQEPDQYLVGELQNSNRGIIRVQDASMRLDLRGREIGLATQARIMTPPGIIVEPHLPYTLGAGQRAAFYFPEEIAPDANFGLPSDYHHFDGATYQRVDVGSTTLFGAPR